MWLTVELNFSPLQFTLRKKNCKSDHGVFGPQKTYFQAYIIHYHDPTDIAVSRKKEDLSLPKSTDHDREMLSTFLFLFCPKITVIKRKERRKKSGRLRRPWQLWRQAWSLLRLWSNDGFVCLMAALCSAIFGWVLDSLSNKNLTIN